MKETRLLIVLFFAGFCIFIAGYVVGHIQTVQDDNAIMGIVEEAN